MINARPSLDGAAMIEVVVTSTIAEAELLRLRIDNFATGAGRHSSPCDEIHLVAHAIDVTVAECT